MKKWFYNNLISIDQLFNTFLGGYPDETLSSRAYRLDGTNIFWSIARATIDKIFFWELLHCFQSYESEKNRTHYPIDFRN